MAIQWNFQDVVINTQNSLNLSYDEVQIGNAPGNFATQAVLVFGYNGNELNLIANRAGAVSYSVYAPSTAGTIALQGDIGVVAISAGGASIGGGTVVFSNSNNISFGALGSTITAQAAFGGVAAGTQTGTSGTIVFSNSNNVTFGLSGSTRVTASFSQTPFGVSAGTQSVSTGTVNFVNSNNFTFGMSNSSQITASFQESVAPAAISAGTTLASNGTVVFSNAGGITWGMAGNTITASVVVTASVSAGIAAISAGTTVGTDGTVQLADSNGISFGAGPPGNRKITASFDGIRSISAGGANAAGSQVVFSNSNGVSFGAAGSTITASCAANVPVKYFENMPMLGAMVANAAVTASTAANLSLQYVPIDYPVSATRFDLLAHLTVVGSTANSFSLTVGVYTMNGSTASLASSGAASFTFNSGTTNSSSMYGGNSGTRYRSLSLQGNTWNITPGAYLFGVMASVGGVAGTTGSMTLYGASSVSIVGEVGGGNATQWGNGIYTAATGALPASIPMTGYSQSGASVNRQPYFRLHGV